MGCSLAYAQPASPTAILGLLHVTPLFMEEEQQISELLLCLPILLFSRFFWQGHHWGRGSSEQEEESLRPQAHG